MKNRLRLFTAVMVALMMLLSVSVVGYADTSTIGTAGTSVSVADSADTSANIAGSAATLKTVPVSIEGKTLQNTAVETGGTLFLPLRSACENLGYSVEWSREGWSAAVKTPDKTVLFEPKKDTITDDGHSYFVSGLFVKGTDSAYGYIGGGCIMVNGRIYVASDLMESCFGLEKTYDQTANVYTLSVLPQGKATVENNRSYSDESKLLTDIQYPFIGLADQAAADKINAVILADVEAAEKEVKDNLADYGEYQSPNRSEIYFNYKITYQQGDFLSIVLWDYQYYGGAHGSTRQITHTFDLKTGAEYTLADLMKADSGYVSYISDTIKADIVKAGMEDAQLTKFESIADKQSYYLSDEGLVIYFQQYEYFPYAAGIMEYTIPYADLNQYLKIEF